MYGSKLLLENPQYVKFKKLSQKLPLHIRENLKHKPLPLLLDFLRWKLVDLQRPQFLHPYGMHFYCGLPGTGKTIFVSKLLYDYKKKFGDDIYIATNYGFKGQDFAIKGYEDLLEIYDKPLIVGFDEIQNEFDARQWKNLDSQFSERITQSRKMNGLQILCTAQKFTFVDKRLRQLANSVSMCRTFMHRLTSATSYPPEIVESMESGSMQITDRVKSKGTKRIVQADYVRDLYDSFQILESSKNKFMKKEEEDKKLVSRLSNLLSPIDESIEDD